MLQKKCFRVEAHFYISSVFEISKLDIWDWHVFHNTLRPLSWQLGFKETKLMDGRTLVPLHVGKG